METTGFPGVMGAVDCTHVLIISPTGDEEAVYVDRKHNHSHNVQLICNYDMLVMDVNARYPGSTHDAAIWRLCNVKRTLMRRYRNGDTNSWILGDSGYPLEPWLLTPILHAPDGTPESRYTTGHCSARCAIERCNGLLKSRFRCLSKARQLNYAPHTAALIVNACVVLHNFCVRNKLPLYLTVGEQPVPDIEGIYQDQYEADHEIDIQNDGRQTVDLLIRRYFQ
ncbi:putative nuclease HARBI1 [Bacillus rossius redtenbacheri]|uniref:putative nuclease HARBI1 n=1 Tax=Bacillus rossius redtenbacheri TaxID=93214 RepID=UPI002FDCEF09